VPWIEEESEDRQSSFLLTGGRVRGEGAKKGGAKNFLGGV